MSPGNSLLASGLRFEVLLLRLQYTIPPNSTSRITANGANSTGQRLVEDTGLGRVGLVVGEDTGLWCVGLVVGEDTGLVAEVIPMKADI